MHVASLGDNLEHLFPSIKFIILSRKCNQHWRKKMFLNSGAVNKIACKACKFFWITQLNTPSNHAHYYSNLAIKVDLTSQVRRCQGLVELELYRAHTPRAHCVIYRFTFGAWL